MFKSKNVTLTILGVIAALGASACCCSMWWDREPVKEPDGKGGHVVRHRRPGFYFFPGWGYGYGRSYGWGGGGTTHVGTGGTGASRTGTGTSSSPRGGFGSTGSHGGGSVGA